MPSGGVLLQALLSGLSAGAVIGLVALGFTLVAGTVRVLHLARHGRPPPAARDDGEPDAAPVRLTRRSGSPRGRGPGR